jgi:hypothetical protein
MRNSYYYLAGALLLAGCGGRVQGGEGSESHWLSACDSSDECGAGTCTCGVCTVECTLATQCPDAVPVCVTDPAAALFAGCSTKATPAGLCGKPTTASNDGGAPSLTEGGTPAPSEVSSIPALGAGSFRLKAIQQEAAGTPTWTIGIWDSAEDLECEFTLAEDGQLRCLPKNAWSLVHAGYSDPNCTQPAFNDISPGVDSLPGVRPAGAPKLLTVTLDACASMGRSAVYEVAPQQAELYSKDGGTCRALGLPASWVATSHVAPERFQLGVRERVPASDNYEFNQVAAEGASFTVGLRSRALDADCSPSVTGDVAGTVNAALCLPPTAGTSPFGYFSDVGCTTPLAYSFSACDYDFALLSVDGEYSLQRASAYSGDVYGGASLNECEALAEDIVDAAEFFELNTEQLPLPTLTPILTGTDRLHLEYLTDGDAWLLPTRYLDVERDEPCQPVLTENAGLRCLPIVEEVHLGKYEIFADSACTLPASRCDLLLLEYTEAGATTLYAAGETPSEQYAVYTWQTVDGVQTCAKDAALSSGGARVPYCTRGESLPLDAFPPITRKIIE